MTTIIKYVCHNASTLFSNQLDVDRLKNFQKKLLTNSISYDIIQLQG